MRQKCELCQFTANDKNYTFKKHKGKTYCTICYDSLKDIKLANEIKIIMLKKEIIKHKKIILSLQEKLIEEKQKR